jgi:hypothetical protein
MGTHALWVAGIAAALLVVSVGTDLAFSQTVSLEAGKQGGTLQLIGDAALGGGNRYAKPALDGDPIPVNRSDTLTLRVNLDNGNPWPSTRSFTITTEGCYSGARSLAVIDVHASARGVGSAEAQISVATLLNAASMYSPKLVGESIQRTQVTLCRGTTDVLYAPLPIQEVPS